MNAYQAQWKQLYATFAEDKLCQAMLWLSPLGADLRTLTVRWSQLLVCLSSEAPCLTCTDCLMAARCEHPDVEWIRPEPGAAIKIDEIRKLQQDVYLTPQRARHRLILIEGTDRMNVAAANALLKILEEPPAHSLFILIAQQLASILPTVLSRCRLIRFPLDKRISDNILSFTAGDDLVDAEKMAVIREAVAILQGLIAVIKNEESPSALAAKWASFDFYALLWFLYLVYAQLLQMHFHAGSTDGPLGTELLCLSALLEPILIFEQLDILHKLFKKIKQQLNPNPSYALEYLLTSFKKPQINCKDTGR